MSTRLLQASQIVAPIDIAPVAFTTASTTATNITALNNTVVYFISDVDCHILFGGSGVAAADTNDLLLPAKTMIPFRIESGSTYFRVIGATASGKLWYFSGSL